MLVILKIPVIYIGAVIYYAIKAEPPRPHEVPNAELEPVPSPWKPWQSYAYNRRRPRPSHGGPSRRSPRASRAATKRTIAK